MEISRDRPIARASKRFARLAQAIKSTNPTAPHMDPYNSGCVRAYEELGEIADHGTGVLIRRRVGDGQPLSDGLNLR